MKHFFVQFYGVESSLAVFFSLLLRLVLRVPRRIEGTLKGIRKMEAASRPVPFLLLLFFFFFFSCEKADERELNGTRGKH